MIELIQLYLETGCNTWNTRLDEYGKVLVTICIEKIWYFEIFSPMVGITIDPRLPLDRPRRVLLGTRLEHAPERIWAGFSDHIHNEIWYFEIFSPMIGLRLIQGHH